MEMHFGEWEGKAWDEIGNTREAKRWFEDYINRKCPGGESFADLIRRVESFTGDIQARYQDKDIWVVCHGGTIRAMHAILEGIPPRDTFYLDIPYGKIIKMIARRK